MISTRYREVHMGLLRYLSESKELPTLLLHLETCIEFISASSICSWEVATYYCTVSSPPPTLLENPTGIHPGAVSR